MKNIFKWIKLSNRKKHLLWAIPASFVGTILFGAGLAFGMEFKDKQYGNKWDNYDILATLIGSLIGQILQLIFIFIIC